MVGMVLCGIKKTSDVMLTKFEKTHKVFMYNYLDNHMYFVHMGDS